MKIKVKDQKHESETSVCKTPKRYSNRNLELNSDEFVQHINEYEQWLRVLGYANSTIYDFPSYVRAFLFLLESKKVIKLGKVKRTHINQFFNYLSQRVSDQTGKQLSSNYQLNYMNALKRFSRYLMDCHGIVLDCTARRIRKIMTERMWLTKRQVESLYSSCSTGASGIMNRAILSVYYGLGLRRSEGVSLDIDDIQISNGVVYVRKGKNSKERYVPMSSSIQKDIEHYISGVRKAVLNYKKQKGVKALFISERGKRISGNAVYERLQFLARNAGLNCPISLHSLRHSIATHLLNAGMKLENIGSFLGHSSLESTQIYTHLIHQKQ